MEKVFLLMWLSDVVGGLGLGLWVLVILGCAGLGFVAIIAASDGDDWRVPLRLARWLLIPFTVGVLLPSPTTIRLMVVASAAEAAASTQLGAKAMEALTAVLDSVIDKAKK